MPRGERPLLLSLPALVLPVALAIALAACSTPDRPLHGGRAVVIHAASRGEDAAVAAERFREAGFDVQVEREGPAVRERSSAIVYRVGRNPSLPDLVEWLLEPVGPVEMLPSVHPGPGTTDVVVWLVADG